MEITKGENGKYTAYIENTLGDPTVKVQTNNEYAYVRIGTNEEERQETEKVVKLKDERTTTVGITIRSQSGATNQETLDLIVTFVVAKIDAVVVDDIEITEYDENTKTYTALVENDVEEHEIYVVADNTYVTLELAESIGMGSVTSIVSFEEGEEVKYLTLYVTGETDLTETYTIVVAQKSSNVKLKSVKVNDVALTLDGETNQYRKAIDKIATRAKVEVITEYPYAKVKVADSTPVYNNSGEVWVDLKIDQDEITIPVIVTAADGNTIETYNIVLTRVASEISGKVITQNHEDKHIAIIKVYRTSDTRAIDDKENPRELIYQGETNEDGTYTAQVPNADNFDMIIEKQGYLTHTVTNIKAIPQDEVKVSDIQIYAGNIVKFTRNRRRAN